MNWKHKHSPNFHTNLEEADNAKNNRAATFFWTVVLITTLMLGFSLTSCKNLEQNYESSKEEVPIESQVIVVTPKLENRPSYTDPKKYKILSMGGTFFIQLPGGTIDFNEYRSVEAAQIEINKRAKRSYDRWVKTNGLDY